MKDAYVAKMQAQVSEWGAKLKEMKAKAEKAAAQGRLEYQQKLSQMKAEEKQEQARRKLEELKMAGEERWEALKSGVEGAGTSSRRASSPARSTERPHGVACISRRPRAKPAPCTFFLSPFFSPPLPLRRRPPPTSRACSPRRAFPPCSRAGSRSFRPICARAPAST